MTVVDSPKHEDRHVRRRCDICRFEVRFECYPRTGLNQRIARQETAKKLSEHIRTHSVEDILDYLMLIHSISLK
jgi:hypothetical protein